MMDLRLLVESAIWIAIAVAGERPDLLGPYRDPAGRAIAESVLVNMHHRFPVVLDAETVVRAYYHGWIAVGPEPPAWALDVSRETWDRWAAGDPSLDRRCLFVLSDHDLRSHMLDGSTRSRSFVANGHALYFFEHWPEPLPSSPRLEK